MYIYMYMCMYTVTLCVAQAPESAGGPESSEAEEWKTRTETAHKELENLKVGTAFNPTHTGTLYAHMHCYIHPTYYTVCTVVPMVQHSIITCLGHLTSMCNATLHVNSRDFYYTCSVMSVEYVMVYTMYIHTQATVEDLTRRLDDSREECERKVLAFEVANDQAQRCQRKLEGEVKKLKEKAEQTKSQFSVTLEENNNLKQMVREDIHTFTCHF